jgi:hypothetical protein
MKCKTPELLITVLLSLLTTEKLRESLPTSQVQSDYCRVYTVTVLGIRITLMDSDPDPACHFDADPDLEPTFHFDADPDPSFQIKAQNLEKVLIMAYIPYTLALSSAI